IAENNRFGSSRINVNFVGTPAATAFGEVLRQAGVEHFAEEPHVWQNVDPVTLELEDATVFEAAAALARQTDRHIRADDAGGVMVSRHDYSSLGDFGSGRVVYVGPVAVRPEAASLTRSVHYETGASHDALSLNLQTMVEPKLRLAEGGQIRLLKAVDEKGQNLLSPKDRNSHTHRHHGMLQLTTRLEQPPGRGTKIAELAGEVLLNVEIASERRELPAGEVDGSTSQIGGLKLVIESLAVNGTSATLKGELQRAGADDAAWQTRFNSTNQSIRLLDAKGNNWFQAGSNTRGSNDTITFEIRFAAHSHRREDNPGEPATLVWELTTATKELVLPFTLTDLKLPPQ
ncbi:MAG: hypothetical protein ACFCVE_08720, partial [Phycisphaerae bacterium]